MPPAEVAEAGAPPPVPARRAPRYRRQLRSRIILSFVLLGFGLTLMLAFATNWVRNRVENELVEDVMNRNIDEYAGRYFADPAHDPAVPFEQLRAYVFPAERFSRVRQTFPEWAPLGDGIHNISGTGP